MKDSISMGKDVFELDGKDAHMDEINEIMKTVDFQYRLLKEDIRKESYIVGLIDIKYLIENLQLTEKMMKKELNFVEVEKV